VNNVETGERRLRQASNGQWFSGVRTVRSIIRDDPRDAEALSGQAERIMETKKTSLIYHLAP
jgi:hypothetical protein